MPILDVSIVDEPGTTLPPDAAQQLAQAAGKIFSSPAGQTWIRLHRIDRSAYAENEIAAVDTPSPVFVEILKAKEVPLAIKREESEALASAFSRILARPVENIHILWQAPASGRIAFGGQLLEPDD